MKPLAVSPSQSQTILDTYVHPNIQSSPPYTKHVPSTVDSITISAQLRDKPTYPPTLSQCLPFCITQNFP